jgi:transposase
MSETLFTLPQESPRSSKTGRGKPRLEKADRQQIEMRLASLDELLPSDHRARTVWDVVQSYDLSAFYARIEAVEGEAGRPAIDPRLLLAVWLYATLEGVGSARALDRLCQEDLAYLWLLGGVRVNYHTLADFRVDYESELDQLLTRSVAALMSAGMVDLEQTAQDGVRIRASAGASSFRRSQSLVECLQVAEKRVQQLKAERESQEDERPTPRQQAARERRARERVERVKQALQEVEKIEDKKA